MLSISSGAIEFSEPPAIPSITISGDDDAARVEMPRSCTLIPPAGSPVVLEMPSPATLPWSSCIGELTPPCTKSSALIRVTEEVISSFLTEP